MTLADASPRPASPPPPPPPATTRTSHVVLVVLGALLIAVGLALTGAAAPLGAALVQQRGGGFVTSPTERYQVESYAITSEQLDVVLEGGLAAPNRAPAATVTLTATSATPGRDVFVGVGPQADVARYLTDVNHSELGQLRFNPFQPSYVERAGTSAPAAPSAQDFWVVSAQGPGQQRIESDVRSGNWSVVVMNADGSRPVAVDLAAGVRSRFLAPVTWTTLVAGLLLLAVGIPMVISGASGLGRSVRPTAAGAAAASLGGSAPPVRPVSPPDRPASYPARLTGELDPQLSRWKWLVKWFLAIPHYVVLFFLGIAMVVTTITAGVMILFTGRYPHSLFHFNVGVIRWGWRVTFYTSVLGTDRYPPFTLSRTDYPADFEVDYPEQLSRGLVLVKSWLLAIPHLLIVGLVSADLTSMWATR
ncbi:MAG: hypothetical protein JWP61_2575, partial [Friedmanniella sp.]|nr:hypothetical protein [Friedmanniella sp.]